MRLREYLNEKKKQIDFKPKNKSEWSELVEKFGLKSATVHQTMGPNWKHIVWLVLPNGQKRPFAVTKNEKLFKKEN